jgi:parallel beta-helix repeat protein
MLLTLTYPDSTKDWLYVMRSRAALYAILFMSAMILGITQECIAMDVISPKMHDPIYIYSNEEFLQLAESEGWVGTGTSQEPIIIEGYTFVDSYHIFTVTDTNLFFEFRSNNLDGVDDSWCVIVLTNVSNAAIHKNTIRAGSVGVHLIGTNNSIISENHMYGQSWDAIFMEAGCCYNQIIDNNFHDMKEAGVWSWNDCCNNLISNNIISNVWYGVSFKTTCSGNTISSNVISNALISGIYSSSENTGILSNTIRYGKNDGVLLLGTDSVVEGNLIHDHGGYGIHLMDGSHATQITGNIILDNTKGGIRIRSSDNNTVENNDFLENGFPLAQDDGLNNVFRHNYWHEWIGEDLDDDGIIDVPFSIVSLVGNSDPEPLAAPIGPIPDWYTFVPVSPPTTTITSTTTTITSTTSPTQISTTPSTEPPTTSLTTAPTSPATRANIALVTIPAVLLIGVVALVIRRGRRGLK